MRLIDADAYADEMRKRQDECLKWVNRTKDIKGKNYTINDIALQAMATFTEAKLTLNKQPTVDAVQVVRCGECKHWESAKDPDDGGLCRALGFLRTDREWYCADGERKDDAVDG